MVQLEPQQQIIMQNTRRASWGSRGMQRDAEGNPPTKRTTQMPPNHQEPFK